MDALTNVLAQDNCPIQNLFIDWNPIYTDEFQGGTPDAGDNARYTPEEEEPSPWATLVAEAKRVQVLFLRHSGLTDRDFKEICHNLKPESGAHQNKNIKVLDLSYNSFTPDLVCEEINSVLEQNRSLEYLGLAKMGLEAHHITGFLDHLGRVPFPAD